MNNTKTKTNEKQGEVFLNNKKWFGSCTSPSNRYSSLNQDSFLCCSFPVVQPQQPLQQPQKGKNVKNNSKPTNHKAQEIEPSPSPSTSPSPSSNLFAVFDGHDLLGELAAETAKSSFASFFLKTGGGEKEKNKKKYFEQMFEVAHKAILSLYSSPPSSYSYPVNKKKINFKLSPDKNSFSSSVCSRPIEFGTTVCSVMIGEDEKIWISWAGDCRVIVGLLVCSVKGEGEEGDEEEEEKEKVKEKKKEKEKEKKEKKEKGEIISFCATIDHNGHNDSEVQRISKIKNEGKGNSKISKDGYLCLSTSDGNSHEISVTRSLGHLKFSSAGVSHLPDVISLPKEEEEVGEEGEKRKKKIKYVVLVSDGVSNVLSADEMIGICHQYETDPQMAAEEIITMATKSAPPDDIDNSTAVVFYL
eukprot:TRINITY_DN1547_c0_g4_i2.p1 TRINITY_DN1547_c0_g4~~TRINITY_DN1547_c0_g4_i2.p1  ORF type:complete len:415 (+),score=169.57 TRINITY_DN1547_c0_g4_i2:68-1312(+)